MFAFAWFYAQTGYFLNDTGRDPYHVHVIRGIGALILVFALLQWTYRFLFRKAATKAGVSTAPVVAFNNWDPNNPELVLADGSTRDLNLLVVPEWDSGSARSKSIALLIFTDPDGTKYLVTKDGECFWKRL
jgi:hypothetical protein